MTTATPTLQDLCSDCVGDMGLVNEHGEQCSECDKWVCDDCYKTHHCNWEGVNTWEDDEQPEYVVIANQVVETNDADEVAYLTNLDTRLGDPDACVVPGCDDRPIAGWYDGRMSCDWGDYVVARACSNHLPIVKATAIAIVHKDAELIQR